MTLKQLASLPVDVPLLYRAHPAQGPTLVFSRGASRDTKGRVLVRTTRLEASQRGDGWRAYPRQLEPLTMPARALLRDYEKPRAKWEAVTVITLGEKQYQIETPIGEPEQWIHPARIEFD